MAVWVPASIARCRQARVGDAGTQRRRAVQGLQLGGSGGGESDEAPPARSARAEELDDELSFYGVFMI